MKEHNIKSEIVKQLNNPLISWDFDTDRSFFYNKNNHCWTVVIREFSHISADNCCNFQYYVKDGELSFSDRKFYAWIGEEEKSRVDFSFHEFYQLNKDVKQSIDYSLLLLEKVEKFLDIKENDFFIENIEKIKNQTIFILNFKELNLKVWAIVEKGELKEFEVYFPNNKPFPILHMTDILPFLKLKKKNQEVFRVVKKAISLDPKWRIRFLFQ